MPPSAVPRLSTPIRRLLVARALRAFGDGFVSLLLPLYLTALGYRPLEVGLIATATLLGSGVMTLVVGARAHRHDFRLMLIAASLLMAATGAGFAAFTDFWPLLVVAFVGTLNPSAGDVSVFLPLEHAFLARVVADRDRTKTFARYAITGTLAGAFGSLAVAAPGGMAEAFGWAPLAAMKAMFVAYALLGLAAGLTYRGLPRGEHAADAPRAALGPSRGRVVTLAALFSLDSLGSGLVVNAMLALYLYQRFDLPVAEAGRLFFCVSLLAAISYIVAVKLADRIGLVNTMVFTHLPANLCLVAVPFVDSLAAAVALLLVRAALSQMDVAPRNSYVMSIVTPPERPAAASFTAVPRSLASAAGPAVAGWLMTFSGWGWPLVAAGGIKIAYDLLLLAMFRRVHPPEEGGG